MLRFCLTSAGLCGAMAVLFGAYGAHSLPEVHGGASELADRLHWWQTATSFLWTHALAFLACAALPSRLHSRWLRGAVAAFALGLIVFSGSLYAMACTGDRSLGRLTPFGGVTLALGWLSLAVAGLRAPRKGACAPLEKRTRSSEGP